MKKRIVTSSGIGEAIKRRRLELGLSQERLADMLNVSYQQVQRYENGSNKLNVENVQVIADLLGLPVASIFSSVSVSAIAEPQTPYAPPEEKNLLKYFRKISDQRDRTVVVSVARLAAEKS